MSEEETGGTNNVKGTIEAATGLVKAIPIYDDLVQPVAKQLGKSLELVGRAVNAALIPVKGLVWSVEEIERYFTPKLIENLKDVPPEDIIIPKLNVAGPAIEALRFTGHEESLSDMYANLLASAMDKKTADGAHPAFVEIIKQLTPDEAKLMALFLKPLPFQLVTVRAETGGQMGGVTLAYHLSLFGEKANLQVRSLVPSYLNNLNRLGLISIVEGRSYTDPGMYDELESSELVKSYIAQADAMPDRSSRLVRGYVDVTSFGHQFGVACVFAHGEDPELAEDQVEDPSEGL